MNKISDPVVIRKTGQLESYACVVTEAELDVH